MRLVLASNNAKKLSELAVLFAGLPLQLVTQGSLGIAEAEEPHATFLENALAKARHAARACGGAAIANRVWSGHGCSRMDARPAARGQAAVA